MGRLDAAGAYANQSVCGVCVCEVLKRAGFLAAERQMDLGTSQRAAVSTPLWQMDGGQGGVCLFCPPRDDFIGDRRSVATGCFTNPRFMIDPVCVHNPSSITEITTHFSIISELFQWRADECDEHLWEGVL